MRDDLVAVDRAAPCHLIPLRAQGRAPGTRRAGWVSKKTTCIAAAEHEATLRGGLEIWTQLRVIRWDDQSHPLALHEVGHQRSERIIALSVPGVPHPRFIP